MIPIQSQNKQHTLQCFDLSKKFERPPQQSSKEVQNTNKLVSNFQNYIQIVNKFAHNYLYCRDPSEMLTVSENKVLTNERSKYLAYINKNFKYKLPEEFTSKKVMKEKRKEIIQKLKQEKMKRESEEGLKATKRKRITKAQEKDAAPKKKIKENQTQKVKEAKPIKKTTKNKKSSKDTEKHEKQSHKEEIVADQQEDIASQRPMDQNFESEEDLRNQDLDDYQESNQ